MIKVVAGQHQQVRNMRKGNSGRNNTEHFKKDPKFVSKLDDVKTREQKNLSLLFSDLATESKKLKCNAADIGNTFFHTFVFITFFENVFRKGKAALSQFL